MKVELPLSSLSTQYLGAEAITAKLKSQFGLTDTDIIEVSISRDKEFKQINFNTGETTLVTKPGYIEVTLPEQVNGDQVTAFLKGLNLTEEESEEKVGEMIERKQRRAFNFLLRAEEEFQALKNRVAELEAKI